MFEGLGGNEVKENYASENVGNVRKNANIRITFIPYLYEFPQ
jgi:hypothetical protein